MKKIESYDVERVEYKNREDVKNALIDFIDQILDFCSIYGYALVELKDFNQEVHARMHVNLSSEKTTLN